MPSILLIAYGNLGRRDDGVAVHILRRLRASLGLPTVVDEDQIEERLTDQVAALAVHQLGPELVEEMISYDCVVFIDAHIEGSGWEPVHWQKITPAYRASIATHHMRPETLLALCLSLYKRCPRGYVLSVLGTDFDLGDELAPETATLAEQATARLAAWLVSEGRASCGAGHKSADNYEFRTFFS